MALITIADIMIMDIDIMGSNHTGQMWLQMCICPLMVQQGIYTVFCRSINCCIISCLIIFFICIKSTTTDPDNLFNLNVHCVHLQFYVFERCLCFKVDIFMWSQMCKERPHPLKESFVQSLTTNPVFQYLKNNFIAILFLKT